MENKESILREIEIAKLEFIGASIATLGDGIIALSAGLALELLEHEYNSSSRSQGPVQLDAAQKQLDYFIHELIKLRKNIT
ncbi:translation initiation factor 2 [Paenibacillus sp. GCM10027627]|uniref:translation initiation factor 2 n=1 Tax=unclassified Paenibacillus TaxID=185978 RepID=UPI003626F988